MKLEVPPKVFFCQSVGFLAIIALSWVDEWLKLPSLLFHDQLYISNFHESILEMLFVLGVWYVVTRATRRVFDRMQHLEKLMKVCAWCHRINDRGQWLSLEQFFERGLETHTTHGICAECLEKEKAALERRWLKEKGTAVPANPTAA